MNYKNAIAGTLDGRYSFKDDRMYFMLFWFSL